MAMLNNQRVDGGFSSKPYWLSGGDGLFDGRIGR